MKMTLNRVNNALEQYDNLDNPDDPKAIIGINRAIYMAVSHKSAPNSDIINDIYYHCVKARNEFERSNNLQAIKDSLVDIRKLATAM